MSRWSGPAVDEIDVLLSAWAVQRGLQVQQWEHWDAVATRALLVDSAGDVYQVHAARVRDDKGALLTDEDRFAVVGAGLVKRGNVKYQAFRREVAKFSYRQEVAPGELPSALDEALQRIRQWVAQAGHEWVTGTPGGQAE